MVSKRVLKLCSERAIMFFSAVWKFTSKFYKTMQSTHHSLSTIRRFSNGDVTCSIVRERIAAAQEKTEQHYHVTVWKPYWTNVISFMVSRAVQRKWSVLLPLEAQSFLIDQLEAPRIQATQHSCWNVARSYDINQQVLMWNRLSLYNKTLLYNAIPLFQFSSSNETLTIAIKHTVGSWCRWLVNTFKTLSVEAAWASFGRRWVWKTETMTQTYIQQMEIMLTLLLVIQK